MLLHSCGGLILGSLQLLLKSVPLFFLEHQAAVRRVANFRLLSRLLFCQLPDDRRCMLLRLAYAGVIFKVLLCLVLTLHLCASYGHHTSTQLSKVEKVANPRDIIPVW